MTPPRSSPYAKTLEMREVVLYRSEPRRPGPPFAPWLVSPSSHSEARSHKHQEPHQVRSSQELDLSPPNRHTQLPSGGQKVAGVDNPLPGIQGVGGADCSDSSPAPMHGPVGGRLRLFAGFWQEITSDRWVLATISQGYKLEFTNTPPSDTILRATPIPANPEKRTTLEGEISSLLLKQAIQVVSPGSGLHGFLSTFFLSPKRTRDYGDP